MSISSEKDFESLRRIGKIVARCLQFMQSKLEPGITVAQLDGYFGDT
jgi:methionyl aminopeptidase